MDKKIIIRNFSRYAYTYDRYADIQRRIALELLGLLTKRDIEKILEIGAGTGNYTSLLREVFINADIKAVDISEKMIEVASKKVKDKKLNFIMKDAEALDLKERFDLITSNACFQWFEDLEAALIQYKELLSEDGFILFSIFGERTLWELNTCCKALFKDVPIAAGNFLSEEKLKQILKKHLKQTVIKEVNYEESFSCLKELLTKIKQTGTNAGGLGARVFFTPNLLKKLEKIYLDRFGKVKATYQVFFCSAQDRSA